MIMGILFSKRKKKHHRENMGFDLKKYIRRSNSCDENLCELQIQVLERSKEISHLQFKLTALLLQCPDSALALHDLKIAMEDVRFKRVTNNYGHGKQVVDIAYNAVDSVHALLDQVPESMYSNDRFRRSISESSANVNRQRKQKTFDKLFCNRTRSCTSEQRNRSTASKNTTVNIPTKPARSTISKQKSFPGTGNVGYPSDCGVLVNWGSRRRGSRDILDIRQLSNLEMGDEEV